MFEAFFQPQPMDVANSNVHVFCAIRMSTSTLVARSKNTNDYVFVSIFNFRIGIRGPLGLRVQEFPGEPGILNIILKINDIHI